MKAGCYLRVSTEDQAREGLSLPAQRDALLAFCRSQGWDVADVYMDDGYSGKNLERPAMSRLLADVAARKVDLVLVYKLDRLSRRQRDVLHLLEDVFEPAAVAFRSVTEPFDTTTPFGKAMLGMLSVFAQLERETIVERSRMGMAQRIKSGDWHGGTRATFGYDYRPEESRALVVNPAQAETVRLIFRLYADELRGYESVARELTVRGWPTPRGAKAWLPSTVRRILRNPIYTGQMLHGFHGARVLYPGNHPALVSDDIFRRVQALMQERREQQAAPKRRSLLSGLLICAECGGKMRSKSQWVNWPKLPKKLHHTYVCYNYLGEPAHLVRVNCKAGYRHGPELEARVIQALCAYAFQPELMEQAIAEVLASADGEVQQAELQNGQLQKGLASVKRRLERYMAAFEDGTLDAVALRERVSELQAKREDLETQVTRITEAQRHREVTTMKAGQVRRDIQALPALLPEMTRDELWTILHSLVAQIRVDAKGQIAELKFWQ